MEIIYFLSRTVEFWDIAQYSQPSWWWRATQNATSPRQSWSDTEPVCVQLANLFLCILHVRNVRRNFIGQFSKKKQYITTLSHPLPSLKWVAARSNMTAGSNIKVLKLSYNFFIFCPICMKFSHNILHTYSFI